MSIAENKIRYNMSDAEAEIREYIRIGMSDEEIYRMLQMDHEITPPRFWALKKSLRKKERLYWELNKNGKAKEI